MVCICSGSGVENTAVVWLQLSSAGTARWGGRVTVASLGGCSRSTHHTWDHQGMKADFGFDDNSQSPRRAFDLTFPAQCLDPGVYFHLHQDWSKPCHPNREESCGSRCTSDSCLSYSENRFRASRLIWAVLVMCLSYNTALLFQNTFCLCVSHESQMRQKLME